jgi:hypothetical protein
MRPSRRGPVNRFAATPVKRSHLVSNSGVGSLVRLRNGNTALIAGLASWEECVLLPEASSVDERRSLLRDALRPYLIRDPELEDATGVNRFYQPPRASSEGSGPDRWQVPAIVFPRSSICEFFSCGAVRHDMPDGGSQPECAICEPAKIGKKNRNRRKRQSPIFLVCSNGHISDIDWSSEVDHHDGCSGADIRITNTTSIQSPRLKCSSCGAEKKLEMTRPCNGSRAWIPHAAHEACDKKMHVVDRTSVQVYFPQTKSSIHVPPKSGIDPEIAVWIHTNYDIRFLDPGSSEHLDQIKDDLRRNGRILKSEDVGRHIAYLKEKHGASENKDEWDRLGARAHELEIFTKTAENFLYPDSRHLEYHETDLSDLDTNIFGPNGLIERVVCLTRLTETRVQDGFTRYTPSSISPIVGFQRMWGHSNRGESWLPAYRAYGEGILFCFNSTRLAEWERTAGLPKIDSDGDRKLSNQGVLAHSFAHLVMIRLSNECGYALPSIRDRMYDLPDGRVAVLVYTADSDIMGTLGGLVEFGEGEKLESVVKHALSDARWCSQDPVCIGHEVKPKERQGSCCHQCLFVPETSCEIMNHSLDRALLVGSTERHLLGIFPD